MGAFTWIPIPAQLDSCHPVPAELNKLFSEASPPPVLYLGDSTVENLLFSWFSAGTEHQQVLPLSVAAVSCESSLAGCWNHTSHFLIRLSIFNQSHFTHLLCRADSCRKQLEKTECSIRAIFLAKNHPQARGKCTRSSKDTPNVCCFSLSLVATTALTAHRAWQPGSPKHHGSSEQAEILISTFLSIKAQGREA